MSHTPFVIALEPEDLTALNEVVEAGAAAEAKWLAKQREDYGLKYLRGRAAREVRATIRVEFAGMRAKGKLAGTKELVVAKAVRAELKRRKMSGPFEPVPHEHISVAGRPVGTGPRHYGQSRFDETKLKARMYVKLPGALAEQLVRGCYWTSEPAVKALLEWQDLWGDGPEVIMREAQRRGAVTVLDMFVAALAPRPDADSILEKARLQEQVVTTGDVVRSAVKRAIR
ncbi:hypothetical protein ACT1U9_32890 (plasmid) [Streptomyces sp. BR1]|uniref:hypothetical protein n=1 Tax=Streptomyces sp. BR1 TaxID=1592323 RepID=UPI00402B42B1